TKGHDRRSRTTFSLILDRLDAPSAGERFRCRISGGLPFESAAGQKAGACVYLISQNAFSLLEHGTKGRGKVPKISSKFKVQGSKLKPPNFELIPLQVHRRVGPC